MKKLFLIALVALIAFSAFASGAQESSNEQVTLEWWTWDATMADTNNAIIAAYEASHPNVKINNTIITTDGGAYATQLAIMAQQQNLPDVFTISSGNLEDWAEIGYLRNLDDLIAKDPKIFDEFYKGMFDATEITGHQLRLFHIFNSFSHPNNNLEDVFSTIDISTVYLNGARQYRVVCRADDVEIAPYVMYVNANTFITTRMETILYTDGGEEFLYIAQPDRFEKRSGVLMPTITKTTIGEDRHEVILLREFELNVTFSDDVFQVPEDKIKIGRKKQE